MVFTYEDLIPTLIENTTMQKVFIDGVHSNYRITPIEGYVLHDKGMDDVVIDPVTMMPTDEVLPGFRTATASCPASYDFADNPREFYAVLASEVPADRIFGGGGNNDHEAI